MKRGQPNGLRFVSIAVGCLAALVWSGVASAQPRIIPEPDAPRAPGRPYVATGIPDRIVLSPGADPAREMGVAYRTDAREPVAAAEIAMETAGPSIDANVNSVTGVSRPINTENGGAIYHQIRFKDLTPDTAYAYRVRGAEGWSEWFSFRTASAAKDPFRFVYFGDMQNGILDRGARVARRAIAHAQSPSLVVHAGDLVASRDDMSHDDEWGEWTAAAGFNLASIPQLPAAGNHEYLDALNEDDSETRVLAHHWPLQFALPGNGADQAKESTYFVDYQGVRFIVLDGTSAIDLGTLETQTAWLERALSEARDRWTIVVMHQPIFTCARPLDTEPLNARWRPVLEAGGADLVLQGHDHCYARWADPPAADAPAKRRAATRTLEGPVYVVSVAGTKMYGLNDRVRTQSDRWAEDTQLYQIVDVDGDRISFNAYLPTGALYDSFELTRRRDGRNRLTDRAAGLGAARTCKPDGTGPDGMPCTAEPKD